MITLLSPVYYLSATVSLACFVLMVISLIISNGSGLGYYFGIAYLWFLFFAKLEEQVLQFLHKHLDEDESLDVFGYVR